MCSGLYVAKTLAATSVYSMYISVYTHIQLLYKVYILCNIYMYNTVCMHIYYMSYI